MEFQDRDVPDSTDWLGTPLAGLMPVEQAFRCYVCKDFYSSPMITSCNHTFCSLCIRRCLSVDGKCPLCRVADQESKLRGNWALREAVDAFCKARVEVLAVARKPAASSAVPKRKATEGVDGSPDSKRTRMSTRLSKSKAVEATAAMAQEEVDVPDEGDDYMDYELEDGLVACPICWARMKPWQVDKHIDTSCPGEPQPKQTTTRNSSRAFGAAQPVDSNPPAASTPERLPSLSYSLLNDAALRKKMAALGISTSGSRTLLERRHQEWSTLWNANCDSARPKSKFELLQDLDVWERTLGGRAPTQSRSASLGAQIKDKDFDGAAWAAKHDATFRDLIANARKSRLKAGQDRSDSDATPPPPVPPAEGQATGAGPDVPEGWTPNQQPGMEVEVVDLTDQPSSQHPPAISDSPVNGEIVGPVGKPGESHYQENKVPSNEESGEVSKDQTGMLNGVAGKIPM